MSLADSPVDHDPPEGVRRPDVELRLPADSAFVSVLRTTTAGLAARLDFTLDDIDDLQMSVGEACAIVLPQADPGSDLTCSFLLRPAELTVVVGVDAVTPAAVDEDSFGWQVLSTLATEVRAEAAASRFSLSLSLRATPLHLVG